MKYLIALALALGLLTSPSHSAAPCVSDEEFATAPFATKAKVEKFWGAKGAPTNKVEPGSPKQFAREYRSCAKGSWVVVLYRKSNKKAQSFWAWKPEA